MLTKIILFYSERNPIGVRQNRDDVCYVSKYELMDGKAREMVRKTFSFMFKLVNDFPPFEGVHFVDEFGTSLYCEVDSNDIWAKRRIITVTRIDKNNNKDVPYVIDAASLRKQIYAMCEYKEDENAA